MTRLSIAVPFFALLALAVGCHSRSVDKQAFRAALNNYYNSRPSCLFDPEVRLPAQAETGNEQQTQGLDALTDAGLLHRTSVEKQRFLIGSKQMNDYDLTADGRTLWTADPQQPGLGNFCVGHPEVKSIDAFTPDSGGATQYSVTYSYSLHLPKWADTEEIKTAFPAIGQESAGQTATATLARENNEWQVRNVSSSKGTPLPQ